MHEQFRDNLASNTRQDLLSLTQCRAKLLVFLAPVSGPANVLAPTTGAGLQLHKS